VERMILYR